MPDLPVEDIITTVSPGVVSPLQIGVARRNPLYPTQEEIENQQLTDYVNSISGKGLPLPADMSDVMPTPFQVKQIPPKNVDTRPKEEKFAEMFGVVPGPEGELGIVQSIKSGLTSPGDIAQGNVANEMIETPHGSLPSYLTRAMDTAGLSITGPLAMKPGTSTLNSGMKMREGYTPKTQFELDQISFAEQHNLPITEPQIIKNMESRIRQIEYDRRLSKIEGEPYPPNGELSQLRTRIKELKKENIKLTPVEGNPFLKSDSGNVGSVISNLTKQIGDLQSQLIVAKKAGQDITGIRNQIKELNAQKQALSEPAGIGHNNPPVTIPKDNLGFIHGVDSALARSELKTGTAEQWINELKRYGVGKEELEFSIGELPKGQITRQQIEDHIAENKVQLQEHWKGKSKIDDKQYLEDLTKIAKEKYRLPYEELTSTQQNAVRSNALKNQDNNPTKYSGYQMPGGTNYREMVMTLPNKEGRYKVIKDNGSMGAMFKVIDENGNIAKDAGTAFGMFGNEANAINEANRLSGQSNRAYRTSHWDEPNPVVHIRMNDRFIPETGGPSQKFGVRNEKPVENGLKTLHAEEIQSDWHQMGRKQGYRIKGDEETLKNNLAKAMDELQASQADGRRILGVKSRIGPQEVINYLREDVKTPEALKTAERIEKSLDIHIKAERELASLNNGVPNAPFKSNWDELALKRLITKAVEEGYDAVSWTPGRHQSTNPSKFVNTIDVKPENGNKYVVLNGKSGVLASGLINTEGKIIQGYDSFRDAVGRNLNEVVGKDIANKILKSEGETKLNNADLEIGGTKEFYDRILVDKANKLVKQYGAKVEEKHLPTTENKNYRIEDDFKSGAIDRPAQAINKYRHAIYFTNPQGEKRFLSAYETKAEAEKALEKLKNDVNKIPVIKLTPELKAKAKQGFNLFSAAPVIIPVDGNPFQARQPKLTPVSFDPFKNPNDL